MNLDKLSMEVKAKCFSERNCSGIMLWEIIENCVIQVEKNRKYVYGYISLSRKFKF